MRILPDAQLSVVSGAAYLGLNKDMVKGRVLGRSYGVEVVEEFRADKAAHRRAAAERPQFVVTRSVAEGDGGRAPRRYVECIFSKLRGRGEYITVISPLAHLRTA